MARKGENIYKRKDGRWEGRYIKSRSSTGKANYGYVYAKSYREVKAKLISQSSCTSNSVTVDPEISSDQFEQVAMEWFQAICPNSANYHSLRHTFATRCIELGFDVKSLSEILGHASVNITMNRYVHPSMDLKKENMQRLSDLLAVK